MGNNNNNQANSALTELSPAALSQISGGSKDWFSNTQVVGGGSLDSFGLGITQTVPINKSFDVIFQAAGNNHQGITYGGIGFGYKW